jgi:hypothetical protein
MRQRLRNSFAFLLAAAGIGLCIYGGLLRHELPVYSEKDIEASVELNLALDLTRHDPASPPDAQQTEDLRQQLRAEVEADIAKERELPMLWLRSGIVPIVLALLLAWPSLTAPRRRTKG